jgi:hypothetical protein
VRHLRITPTDSSDEQAASVPDDLVFPQEADDHLAVGAESGPHGSTPILDRRVAIRTGRRGQYVRNRYAAPILRQRRAWPRSFSTSEYHVCLLDLTARKLLFKVEIKANQTEHDGDWLAAVVRRLHCECVHDVLQDESGAAHRVDIHLIVGGTHRIHIEDILAKASEYRAPSPVLNLRNCAS